MEILSGILERQRAIDDAIQKALRGRSFSPQELIALQAKVIQYSQEVEVASRLIEKLTSTVRQTMQTQI